MTCPHCGCVIALTLLDELNATTKREEYEYRRYVIFFDGWQGAQDNTRVIGRWLAWKIGWKEGDSEEKAFAFSVVGGYANFYKRGNVFDLAQKMPTCINDVKKDAEQQFIWLKNLQEIARVQLEKLLT